MKMDRQLETYISNNPTTSYTIQINIAEQNCYVFNKNSEVFRCYKISTSKFAVSNEEGSNGTPTGLHIIHDCIGADEPLGMEFKGRMVTGEIIPILHQAPENDNIPDYVLTRVLWLKGLQDGINLGGNVDTYRRYVYFHGTNQEYLIGTPSSHGCIRMKNADIVELFSFIPAGTVVFIG